MDGAVAACGQPAAEFGAELLRAGGNAADAAVGAMLLAFASAPVMSSPAGGGFAVIRPRAGEPPVTWDFFPHVPGLPAAAVDPGPLQFTELKVDYGGGVVQPFHVGRGAAAVPAALAGLMGLQRAHGGLAFEELADRLAPRVREGFALSAMQARFLALFSAILTFEPSCAAHYAPGGRLAREGDKLPALGYAAVLEEAARSGVDPLTKGAYRERILEEFGAPRGLLTGEDFDRLRPNQQPAPMVKYRDALVYLPGAPSLGAAQVALGLRALDGMPAPGRAGWRQRVGGVMGAVEEQHRREPSRGDPAWATEGRAEVVRARAAALEAEGAGACRAPGPLPGNTTHVSAVDAEGGAVAITTSYGECCGVAVPGLGLGMNNFLGEEDLNPGGFHRQAPGSLLASRMTPTLVQLGDGRMVALGTGGSDRIAGIVLQAVLRLVDLGLGLEAAVEAPRIHRKPEGTYLEVEGVDPDEVARVTDACPEATLFARRDLYFGGMHSAVVTAAGEVCAVGDRRRDGRSALSVTSGRGTPGT